MTSGPSLSRISTSSSIIPTRSTPTALRSSVAMRNVLVKHREPHPHVDRVKDTQRYTRVLQKWLQLKIYGTLGMRRHPNSKCLLIGWILWHIFNRSYDLDGEKPRYLWHNGSLEFGICNWRLDRRPQNEISMKHAHIVYRPSLSCLECIMTQCDFAMR